MLKKYTYIKVICWVKDINVTCNVYNVQLMSNVQQLPRLWLLANVVNNIHFLPSCYSLWLGTDSDYYSLWDAWVAHYYRGETRYVLIVIAISNILSSQLLNIFRFVDYYDYIEFILLFFYVTSCMHVCTGNICIYSILSNVFVG